MTAFVKLDQIRKHLRLLAPQPIRPVTPEPAEVVEQPGQAGARVQKNLTILQRDADRMAALAKRDGLSQARLLSAALDAYQEQSPLDEK